MSHFTYVDSPDFYQLKQGDILGKTDAINEILEKVHPHYLKEDYKYFIVLTQTCDLVKRDNSLCKTPYITLACVRPLETLLKREISKYQSDVAKRIDVCSDKHKSKFEQFLDRILNNNEPEYFFLQEEPATGFPESCIAFLRLSISIKAQEHYDTCLDAKILELEDSFKAKLGWIVGNMYSRVGTVDWNEKDRNTLKSIKSKLLNEVTSWYKDKILSEYEKEYNQYIKDKFQNDLFLSLEDYQATYRTEETLFLESFTEILEKLSKENYIVINNQDFFNRLVIRMRSNSTISSVLKKLK